MKNGHCYSFGVGTSGELGTGKVEHKSKVLTRVKCEEKFQMISVGSGGHCLAVTQDGECYSWGNCHYGKLGPEAEPVVSQLVPVVINEFKKPDHQMFNKLRRVSLISDTFLTRGISEKTDEKKYDVQSVASSYSNSFIVDNGKLYSIGVNENGMLGIGNKNIMLICEITQV